LPRHPAVAYLFLVRRIPRACNPKQRRHLCQTLQL